MSSENLKSIVRIDFLRMVQMLDSANMGTLPLLHTRPPSISPGLVLRYIEMNQA